MSRTPVVACAHGFLAAVCLLAAIFHPAAARSEWQFVDVTEAAGLNDYAHGYVNGYPRGRWGEMHMIAGGAAPGDFDGDGWLDLYMVRGDIGPNLLYRNLGDGTFAEMAAAAGVEGPPVLGTGPLFADLDGDYWPELLVGELGKPPSVYRNRGDGTFELVPNGFHAFAQFGVSLGDLDGDGDLDLAAAHWILGPGMSVWRKDGLDFTEITSAVIPADLTLNAFTPIFTDMDNDGDFDLLVAADFGTSTVFLNDDNTSMGPVFDPVITDENGMGAAVEDYDNDGDMDWFVSSIWDPNTPVPFWGVTGNRLYTNDGTGTFADMTTEAGVRKGAWGWGSCFADFNNDGHLDLFHVNGFPHFVAVPFHDDPSRLFMANGDGTFQERSAELGIIDLRQGRGIVCFDYDWDGDIDIFIANNSDFPRLYRNDGGNDNNFLIVKLIGPPENPEGVGARVFARVGETTQMRELRAGSNFASSNPTIAHFGLGESRKVDELRIEWPDGRRTVRKAVPARRVLVIGPGQKVQMRPLLSRPAGKGPLPGLSLTPGGVRKP